MPRAELLDLFQRSLALIPGLCEPSSPRRVLLAVSGGSDSLCLMAAVAALAEPLRDGGFHFCVVTVDHALRPESADEARHVGELAARLALPHETRRWVGDKPAGNRQAEAREARYGLIEAAARNLGAVAVMTAHHQDDQIETHLLRRSRGAGARGLAGMRPCRQLGSDLHLLRPFLDIAGERLKATVREWGLQAIEDPSNDDLRYDRVRWRRELAEGRIDRGAVLAALIEAGQERARLDDALGAALHRLLDGEGLGVSPQGVVLLDAGAFAKLDPALAAECLGRLVPSVAGALHPPERAALERLAARLLAGEPVAATLGGTTIVRPATDRSGTITLMREFGRAGPADSAVLADRTAFDRRLLVETPDRRGWLVAAGRLGIGNAAQRTLPVLVATDGAVAAVPDGLARKFPQRLARLVVREDISWRIFADLGRRSTAIAGEIDSVH